MQKVLLALVLVAAAVGGYLAQQRFSEDAAPVPEQQVAFTLPDLEGRLHSLDEWGGRARLVNFWATWCAPCRREIPLLKRAQAEHGAGTLQVIGVAVDKHEDVVAYAETAEFNYPILIGQDEAIAAAEGAGVPFIGLPFTLVISPEGDLIKTHMGEIFAEQIEQIIDVLERLETGELDLAAARRELGRL